MGTLEILIGGVEEELEWLSQAFDDPLITLSKPDESDTNWRMSLDIDDDPPFVEQENFARGLFTRLRGQAVLHGLPSPSLSISGIRWISDEGRTTGAKSVGLSMKVIVPPIEKFAVSQLASIPGDVENVLRICSEKNATWTELYKILENVTNSSDPVAKGWATRSRIALFKRTANSQPAIGDEARHGPSNQDPPKTPMKIGDARTLIYEIVRSWISLEVSARQ